MTTDPKIKEARDRLAHARSVAVLTGAGISADSGVPTFRGTDGLWRNVRAEDLATPEAFERDPRLVWEWYDWRRTLLASIKPNAAHEALATLEARQDRFHLITQNVDGLHHLAGSRRVLELHGDIWKVRCVRCRRVTDNRDVPLALLPQCDSCDGLLRPHIVWFGEALDHKVLEASVSAVESCDILLIVGTSGLVYPAAMLMPTAKANGAVVMEVNLDATPYSAHADFSFQGCAKDIVPLLL
ncbi:MAG: NAD-dependent deacylase [Nitrospira sp.]|nr:NAD-dependent deacylase [Nitrospira sp.]